MAQNNPNPLRGSALVTGAGKRLGKAIAMELATQGMDVCVHYNRSQAEAEGVVNEIKKLGRNATMVQGDLRDELQVAAIMQHAMDWGGETMNVLINSASIFPPDTLMDGTFEALIDNMRVNAYTPLQLCRLFAQNGRSGNIVNLLDSRMTSYDSPHVSYHLSKKSLNAITRMLAWELAPAIRVNAVAPGLVLPPVNAPSEAEGLAYMERSQTTLPLQRHGGPDHIASAIAFLLSNDFITGETINVDGGRHLKGAFYG